MTRRIIRFIAGPLSFLLTMLILPALCNAFEWEPVGQHGNEFVAYYERSTPTYLLEIAREQIPIKIYTTHGNRESGITWIYFMGDHETNWANARDLVRTFEDGTAVVRRGRYAFYPKYW